MAGVAFVLGVGLGAMWSLAWLLWYFRSVPPVTRAPLIGGRSRRRGSWRKHAASRSTSPATTRRTVATHPHAGSTSSFSPPGGVSVGWATRRAQRDPSRITGRGWSTPETATPGGNGRLLRSVGSGDAA